MSYHQHITMFLEVFLIIMLGNIILKKCSHQLSPSFDNIVSWEMEEVAQVDISHLYLPWIWMLGNSGVLTVISRTTWLKESPQYRRGSACHVLKCTKMVKSPGPDQVYPETLWKSEGVPDRDICLIDSHVRKDWRAVNVVPLFKKDCTKMPGNFRLESLISVVGKLLEEMLSHPHELHTFGKAKTDYRWSTWLYAWETVSYKFD